LDQIRRIARQGRVRGFRVFSVTQRAATVNKNLITQLSTLVTFQISAPQDTRVLDEPGHGCAPIGSERGGDHTAERGCGLRF
jgi:hypothetical protein